jgi:hypothetical protein
LKYAKKCKKNAVSSFFPMHACGSMQKEEQNVQAVMAVMPHFFNVSLAVVTLRPTLRGTKDGLAI